MNHAKCRQCGYKLDTGCTHQQCAQAHAQGFCGTSCQGAYLAIKDYEMDRARREANG